MQTLLLLDKTGPPYPHNFMSCTMFTKIFMLVIAIFSLSLLLLVNRVSAKSVNDDSFIYQGFEGASLTLNGYSVIEYGGVLRLTNLTKEAIGHSFYPTPFNFINSSTGNNLVVSFSTVFVFAIIPQYPDVSAHGLAFTISPSKEIPGAGPSQYLGLFNLSSNGLPSNHIFAVELDCVQNTEYNDIDDNHVGIDINNLESNGSASAAYISDEPNGGIQNLSLISGLPMKVWVDYDGESMRLNVTISPIDVPKPRSPLLSTKVNLSSVFLDEMYVGFSSSTGAAIGRHYILGWSFSLNGEATELDVSNLPSVPNPGPGPGPGLRRKQSRVLIIGLPVAIAIAVLLLVIALLFVIIILYRKNNSEKKKEDWEVEFGPHRFAYKDLHKATKGFRDENLLGSGGFGVVFKGVLPRSNLEVAVKRVSHGSKQGMKEFVSEIASMGRVRHRNLVQLLGYSRRLGDLLLVYDFMPHGSLDKYLFDRPEVTLNWNERFTIIKGIAAGLLYLHEEWEQVILHRDIKASNVLLDHELNGRLGDFGLARLQTHGDNPQTTHVVGTFGYLAPEISRTGKATTSSDVFAFGAFLLEVACGRRPVELKTSGVEWVLVDWVLDFFKHGKIIEARDRRLGDDFVVEEMEMVLKLGLHCSQLVPTARPSMRQVVQFLEGDVQLPVISEDNIYTFSCVVASKINGTCSDQSTDTLGCGLSVSDTILSEGGR